MTSEPYKLAVQSAGFDQNADYTWVAYLDQKTERQHIDLGRIIDGNTPGVMVQKVGDRFAVLLCGIKASRFDYQNRTIFVKFYVGELTEEKARGVVIAFLTDEGDCIARLLQTLTKDASEQGWAVDFEQIASVIETIPEAPSAPPFSERRSNVYEESTKSVLIDELRSHAFSPNKGYKLYWGGVTNLPEYKEPLLREVDRFYSPTASDAILGNDVTPVKKTTPAEFKPEDNKPIEGNCEPRDSSSRDTRINAFRNSNERSSQTPKRGFRGNIQDSSNQQLEGEHDLSKKVLWRMVAVIILLFLTNLGTLASNNSLQKRNHTLKENYQRSEKECQLLEKECQQSEKKCQQLAKELETSLKTSSEQTTNLQNQLQKTNLQNEQLKKQITDLQSELEKERSRLQQQEQTSINTPN